MKPVWFVRCDASETFGVAPAAMAEAGMPVAVWDAINPSSAPPALEDAGGIVLFGSTYNVEHADEQPFIPVAAALSRDAVARGVPYLGICFGAQLLAHALGADVTKAPVREIGFEPLRPAPAAATDPLLGHLGDGDAAFQWHMDTFALPQGATLLIGGDRVPNQAFRVGNAWGMQFHFEIDRPEVALWVGEAEAEAEAESEGDLAATWGKTGAEVLAEAERLGEGAERRGAEVFRRFAALVRAGVSA